MCGPADNLYTFGAKLNKVGKQMVKSLIGEGWASRYAGKRNAAAAATGVFIKFNAAAAAVDSREMQFLAAVQKNTRARGFLSLKYLTRAFQRFC
jgi:hypothetical protein